MKVYILFRGCRDKYAGRPIAAFRTKKSVRDYVKKNYPYYKKARRTELCQMLWESEYGWLVCNENEPIEVIE